ncbi:MAG: gamma-glutamyl-gamma-aminobutyrate hydrolase family protein [Oscillospiraceae bacterium]|nr:gamma-glutamyl-gamma-aminobutyrate hydrolase family protein [Oscillospiraceae bacterium]
MKPRILISTGGGNAANYLAAVEAAGGVGEAQYLPAPSLGYDGLLLAGGDDMDPALFGQENRGSRGIDRARDEAELALLDAFLGANKPVLAICRGHQVVNVWLGGDLIQDLGPELVPFHRKEEGDQVHSIRAEEGSLLHRLYGPVFPVNSSHHQGLGRLGRGLTASAWSEGGVIEAVEHDTLPLISVQFHPERMTGALARPDTVDGGEIFRAFLELCK